MSAGNLKADLKQFSDAALANELKRREDEKKKAARPVAKLVIDWSRVTDMFEREVASLSDADEEDRYLSKDFQHYVFEEVLEAIYGKDIWGWWNEMAN